MALVVPAALVEPGGLGAGAPFLKPCFPGPRTTLCRKLQSLMERAVAAVRMTQITALVLRVVAGGHRYGFDVMEACGLPSGTVYPALRRLDRAGLLKSRWEGAAEARADGRPQIAICAGPLWRVWR